MVPARRTHQAAFPFLSESRALLTSAATICLFALLVSSVAILLAPPAAESQTPGQLTLIWKDSDSGLTGFTIQRKTGTGGTYAQVATVGPAVFSYVDGGLVAGNTYCYQVVASAAAGLSPPSNELCALVTTATFPLTVTTTGTGTGTVTSTPGGMSCTSTCSASFPPDTSVTLTATAASGSTFSGWNGACSGTVACTLRMTSPQNVTATFTAVPPPPSTTYTLSVSESGNGSGSVTSAPAGINCGNTCSASFPPDTSVTLTATAASGSTFSGWNGACKGSGICTLRMTKAQSVTASFRRSKR